MITATLGLRYDMVNCHIPKWKHYLTAAAYAFLFAIKHMLVGSIAGQRTKVCAARYVGSVVDVEEQAHIFL